MFLIGFGILVYPTAADQWNTYRQNRLISSYEDTVEEMEPEDFTREWEAARSFNATILRIISTEMCSGKMERKRKILLTGRC